MKIDKIINNLVNENRVVFYEHEAYDILNEFGLSTPKYEFININEINNISNITLNCSQVVVKVVSKEIFHKTELKAVKFCENNSVSIKKTINEIYNNTKEYNIAGFLIVEKIFYKSFLGSELIFSIKYNSDFKYLISFGLGGTNTEFYGLNLKNSFTVFLDEFYSKNNLEKNLIFNYLKGANREHKVYIDETAIYKVIDVFIKLKTYINKKYINFILEELEINPFVISNNSLMPLDAIFKIKINNIKGDSLVSYNKLDKLNALFKPKTIGIAGVSSKNYNMGRIILNNIIDNSFNKEDVYILKEEDKFIDGVRCYNLLNSIPVKLDLFVIAVNASSSINIIKELIQYNKAKSIILIPGGFAESSSGANLESEIINLIKEAKSTNGPILVGGNCLGIKSIPGNYDTFFIPKDKITYNNISPYAFISQSGAFIISKQSKTNITPLYSISIGNQMDLAFSDYLDYFINNQEIKLIALYIEGFKEQDACKTALKVKQLISEGKKVIIYKAGRTIEGKNAASGHTAAIAGDYKVFEEIFKSTGAIVVDNFTEFEDLIKISSYLSNYNLKELRLGILSNAGFETVGIADNTLSFAKFSNETKSKIYDILKKTKIDKLVNINNPLDLTPVADDITYFNSFKTILEDENVNLAILSCIPMTRSIKSLEKEIDSSSVFKKLNDINTKKPYIIVVDSGKLYDYACSLIKEIPVFRTTDTAIKALNKYFN